MRWILLALALVGCQLPEVPADGGGCVANPNLLPTKRISGNLIFTGNVKVIGDLNQGQQQQSVNIAQATAQVPGGPTGATQVPYFGDQYNMGTYYQALGAQWVGPIANSFAGQGIQDEAYGNGVIVAVSVVGTISRSTDNGATWSALIANSHGGTDIDATAYGNSVFVIGGGGGKISRSTDYGVTWSALIVNPFGAGDTIQTMVFANGAFIAGGSQGRIARSTDNGATWGTLIANPIANAAATIFALSYGSGVTLAGGNDGAANAAVARSDDLGVTWTLITNPFGAGSVFSIGFGNAVFTAGTSAGKLARSIDYGLTWGSLITNPFAGKDIVTIAYLFGIFQSGTGFGTTARSYDNGLTWGSLITNPVFPNVFTAVIATPTNIVGVGSAGSIATAGWNPCYSLVAPVPGEPSLGTPHDMSYANRTATLVVNTSTTPAATWSAAVTLTYAPTGANWAYCMAYRAGAANPDAIVFAKASGMTLDTAAGFQYKYPGVFLEVGGVVGQSGMVWIPIDSNKQFKWCTVGGNALIHVASPVAYCV